MVPIEARIAMVGCLPLGRATNGATARQLHSVRVQKNVRLQIDAAPSGEPVPWQALANDTR
jgi:hypothetical protein